MILHIIKKNKKALLFLLMGLILLALSLNMHSRAGIFNYHSEISADKAGYNVYLPFTFINKFNAAKFPRNIVKNTGYGFQIDSINNKMITKYPYGVALLQSPFWYFAHILSSEKNGYGIEYHKAIDVAGVFYLVIGLYFSYLFFRKYFSDSVSVILMLGMLLGTNLFYFGIYETGMSHVYSFCFISIFIYLAFERPSENNRYIFYIKLGLVVGIIFVIRHLNIVFIIPLFFLDCNNFTSAIHKIKCIILNKYFVITIFIIVVFLLPQLIYYSYSLNNSLTNPYKNESFIYWNQPKILEVLIAPNNGLFLYSPFIVVCIISSVYFFKKTEAKIAIVIFTFILYTYSSWWSYELGCSFGHRGMIEFYTVIILCLGYFLRIDKIKYIIYTLLFICIFINIRMTYVYDSCFYGTSDWDWNEYKKILFSSINLF